MYGTIAKMQVKPGMEQRLQEFAGGSEGRNIPGYVNSVIYRMDANPNEYYLAVVFESKDAYLANANSPEQDADYRKLLELLVGEPEWHDGEIVYNGK
jgi:quinol monooxygenase YgiN